MNSKNPEFWALIGFGVGAVIAAAGAISGPFESLVSGLMQAAIWYGVSSLILNKKNKTRSIPKRPFSPNNLMNISIAKLIRIDSVKTCDECKKSIAMSLLSCPECGSIKFTYPQDGSEFNQDSSEESFKRVFGFSKTDKNTQTPEYKNCPMCDEQIRFAAKKCRFCQELL